MFIVCQRLLNFILNNNLKISRTESTETAESAKNWQTMQKVINELCY